MDISDYEYLWNEDKEDYVLLRVEEDYLIIDRVHQMVLLIEDDDMSDRVIAKMIEEESLIFDTLEQAYDSVSK
ncbi:MAG: hypothetical protein K1W36_13835 [Lachnospiraceae bacterium]|jgi:hypothetical protein